MAKPLKKLAKPAKVTPKGAPGVYVRVGSNNTLTEWRMYLTDGAARSAMVAHFEGWKPWCQRYASAGIEAISTAIDQIPGLTITHDHKRITADIDPDYSKVVLAAEVKRL